MLRKQKITIAKYREAVKSYRHAQSKAEKWEMEALISKIKMDFSSEISGLDLYDLNNKVGLLANLKKQISLFEETKEAKKIREDKTRKAQKDVDTLTAKIEDLKSNKMYQNAFEWRFEFPEVLNDKGDFLGFDVVIGNPPYIRQEEFSDIKPYLQNNYQTYAGTADLYVYFVEKGLSLIQNNGGFTYILPNKWLRAGYGEKLRQWAKQYSMNSIIDFGDLPVFEEATTYPCVWSMTKAKPVLTQFSAATIDTLTFSNGLDEYINRHQITVNQSYLADNGWALVSDKVQQLLQKLKSAGTPLEAYADGKIYRGLLTGLNDAFVIDEATKHKLITKYAKNANIIKPFLAGREIKRYQQPQSSSYLM